MHRALRVAFCACLWVGATALADQESIQERIDRAAELNVTAPWQESQRLLDELKPELERATQRQRARVRLLESRNLALSGDYRGALESLRELRDSDVDPDLRIEAYRLSANCALNQGDFENGFQFLKQGLALLRLVDDPTPRTNLLSLAAYYHSQAGEGELGVRYANEALAIANSSGNPRLRCIALHELALAEIRSGNEEAAFATRREMLRACEEANDPVFVGVAKNVLGEMLLARGEAEEALPIARDALQTLENAGYRDGMLVARLRVGMALIALGRRDEGEALLIPLVDEFESLGYWQDLRDTHRELANLAELRGEYEVALDHHKAAEAASENFLDRDRAMRLAYLEVEFDTQRKEQQIALLSERNQVLELQETTRRQQYYIAAGSIVALSVIGALLAVLLLKSRTDRRRLLRLSQRDSLTGLYNHTNFFRHAGRAMEASVKNAEPFTLLLADIDHFKAINDRHGHVAGDRALREVGKCFRDVFEPGGICGRIGGEEFGVALPRLDSGQARDLIRLFNRRMVRVAESGGVMRVTMSYGLAEAGGETSLDQLRQLADEALYEAKRRGRDCTVAATEMTG